MLDLGPTEIRKAEVQGQNDLSTGQKVGWGEELLGEDAVPTSELTGLRG